MAKNLTIAERREAALKRISKIAAKKGPTPPDSTALIDALGMLAEANIKTMSIEQAHQWAQEFTAEHPGTEAARWAWRMVGQVEAHQESPRGPRAGSASVEVSENCLRIVRAAARYERFGSKDLSKEEIDRLERRVASICDSQLMPHFDRQQIKQALKKIFGA